MTNPRKRKPPLKKRTRPNDVGYGRPPRAHQFKPGQSGNKQGRPKGTKNEAAILRTLLNRKIEMRRNGRLQMISLLEAIYLKFAEEALMGNPKAAAFLLNRHASAEPPETEPTVTIDTDDEQILQSYARKLEALLKMKEKNSD